MGKYDFIKEGNVLFWHDPDNGLSDGVYQVVSVPEVIVLFLLQLQALKRRFIPLNFLR